MDEYDPHPWGEFLKARTRCILWLSENRKRSDDEIAFQLSMDSMQVCSIREYAQDERDKPYKIALGNFDKTLDNRSTKYPNGI